MRKTVDKMKKCLFVAGFLLVFCCSPLLFAPSQAKSEASCQHLNLYDDIARDADFNPRYGYVSSSPDYHYRIYERQQYCADCGIPVGEPYYDYDDVERGMCWEDPHTFNEDFECTLCGYKKWGVELSKKNFPDAGLRAYLQTSQIDWNQDGFITLGEDYTLEMSGIYINTENEIHSLQGLELLPIAGIWMNNAQMEEIDLSVCPNVEYVTLTDISTLKCLNLSQNTKIKNLAVCNCANLSAIDVSNCPLLQDLNCSGTPLIQLDLSANTKLISLLITDTHISVLDLSANSELTELVAERTPICTLDLQYNPKLKLIIAESSSLTTLNLDQNSLLEHLDLNFCVDLDTLDVTHCPNLGNLYCEYTAVKTLDLSQNTLLENLSVDNCQLGWLDISANTALQNVTVNNNIYYLKPENGRLNLTALQGFDATRASDWRGGTVSGNALTFLNYEVSFTYDLGQGHQQRFTWAQGGKANGYSYRLLNDGTISIIGCSLTGNVVIPRTIDGYTVTNLGNNLFRFSLGIASVTMPETVTSLGDDPSSLLAYVFLGRDLEQILVSSGNPAFVSVDGVLYSKDMATLFQYPRAKTGGEYHIPESVTWIDCGAFSIVKNLRSLYIEGKETSWPLATFATNGCPLTVYYRKGGRTEIRVDQAFEYNEVLDEYFNWPFYMSFGDDGDTSQFAYEAKADEIIQSVITADMSDVQKARALHNYIINHTHYSMKYDDETGILIYGEGHCQGYSKTFKLLLDKVGIENRLVTGSSRESFVGHMWNQIKIGNIWYHADCTWDDPSNPGYYDQEAVSGWEQQTYFMVSTQFILRDHIWDDPGDDLSGWAVESGETVYHDLNGQKVTGWLTVDGNTFYFDANGNTVEGIKVINGKIYTFDAVYVFTDASGDHYAGAISKQDLPQPNIILPAALTSVGPKAFAGIPDVVVWVPDTVNYIASDAFDPTVTILCTVGSYAKSRSEELGLECLAK